MKRAALHRRLIPLVAAAVVGLAGCGSSTTKPSSTTTPSTVPSSTLASCSNVAALQSSLQHLGTVDVVKQGTQSLTAALQDVSTNLHNLANTASAALRPQIDAVQTSLNQLQTAVKGFANQPSAGAAAAVSTAVKNVETVGQNLKTKAQAGCPSPTGS